MIPVLLTEIKTRDAVTLHGIAVLPRQKSATALIWIHGLGSNFAHGAILTKELSSLCHKNNIGYFKFNTRGHDVVNRDGANYKKKKGTAPVQSPPELYGAGFEKFEECIMDIRAMASYAEQLGYQHIILAGHSTGANKTLYYMYKTRDRRIQGIMLLGPISDISAAKKEMGSTKMTRGLAYAKNMLRKNKTPYTLMPASYGVFQSVQRFVSLCEAGQAEDVFPYHNPNASWHELHSIRQPICVILGAQDEYLDRPAQDLIEIFRSHAPLSKSPAQHLSWTAHGTHDMLSGKGAGFNGVIIKNADHGFHTKEKELSRVIIDWIKRAMG